MDTPEPPQPVSDPKPASGPARKSTYVLEAVAVILLLLDSLAGYADQLSEGGLAEAIGGGFAPLILVLVVVGAFRMTGRGKTRRSRAIIACWTLGLMYLGQATMYGQRHEQVTMSDADRAGLAIEGDKIRHTTLGFALPYVEGFGFDPALQGTADKFAGRDPGSAAWALRAADGSAVMLVMAVKGRGSTGEFFERFSRGVRDQIVAGSATVVFDSLDGTGEHGQYRLLAHTKEGAYSKIRCVPSMRPQGGWVIACVLTATREPNDLDPVIEGLQFTQH